MFGRKKKKISHFHCWHDTDKPYRDVDKGVNDCKIYPDDVYYGYIEKCCKCPATKHRHNPLAKRAWEEKHGKSDDPEREPRIKSINLPGGKEKR